MFDPAPAARSTIRGLRFDAAIRSAIARVRRTDRAPWSAGSRSASHSALNSPMRELARARERACHAERRVLPGRQPHADAAGAGGEPRPKLRVAEHGVERARERAGI